MHIENRIVVKLYIGEVEDSRRVLKKPWPMGSTFSIFKRQEVRVVVFMGLTSGLWVRYFLGKLICCIIYLPCRSGSYK